MDRKNRPPLRRRDRTNQMLAARKNSVNFPGGDPFFNHIESFLLNLKPRRGLRPSRGRAIDMLNVVKADLDL